MSGRWEARDPSLAVPMTRSVTPLDDLRSLVRLCRICRQERFTIGITHNPKPGLLGQLAARLTGVRSWSTPSMAITSTIRCRRARAASTSCSKYFGPLLGCDSVPKPRGHGDGTQRGGFVPRAESSTSETASTCRHLILTASTCTRLIASARHWASMQIRRSSGSSDGSPRDAKVFGF